MRDTWQILIIIQSWESENISTQVVDFKSSSWAETAAQKINNEASKQFPRVMMRAITLF